MKNKLKLPLLALLLLSGCQLPMVKTSNHSFSAKFIVDGKLYDLKTDYTCHYENTTWLSAHGYFWHIRDGISVVRVVGKLEDGSLFEVLPRSPYWNFSFCHAGSIDASLFIQSNDLQVESFNKSKGVSTTRNVQLIDTKLTYNSSGLGVFVEAQSWPKQLTPTSSYYTVQATVYENSRWKNNPEIVDLIKSKKILWLESANSYPFLAWSNNDKAFAKLRQGDDKIDGYNDSAIRFSLIPDGDSWVFSSSNSNATKWRTEPLPSNLSEKNELTPSQKFKRWVVYGDTRIELPLRDYYRLFYEPEHDRLIEFRAEHVGLW